MSGVKPTSSPPPSSPPPLLTDAQLKELDEEALNISIGGMLCPEIFKPKIFFLLLKQ